MTYQPSTPARPILAVAAVTLSAAWLVGMTVLPAALAPTAAVTTAASFERNDSAVVDADGHVRLASVKITIY